VGGTQNHGSGCIAEYAGFSNSGNGSIAGGFYITGGSGTATGTLGGTGTLGLNGGTLSIGAGGFAVPAYSQAGGALDGVGDLTVNTGFYWSSGTMTGSGRTIVANTVTAGIIHTIEYGITQPVLTRTLENHGTISHEKGYFIGNLTINAGGVLDNRGSYLFTENTGIDGTGGAIINSGTFGKSGGTGSSTIAAAFTNSSGLLDVTMGQINVSGGFHLTGIGSIAGGIYQTGGSGSLNGTLSGTGTVGLTGGTLSVAGASSVPSYYQYGGLLDGSGDLTATGGFYWGSGTMSGSGKTIVANTVTAGTIHTIEYGISQPVLTRILENHGTINHEKGYYIGSLTINAGGVLDNRGSYLFTENTGIDGTGGSIINSGTFGKSGGTGASNLHAAFSNVGGTQNHGSGCIAEYAGFSNSGNGSITGGFYITSGSGTATGTLGGTGTLGLNGGTLNIGAGGFAVPAYSQTSGTLDGAGDLTVNTGFYWSSGTMTGVGKTIVGAGVTAGTIHTIEYGIAQPVLTRTLENHGTISHENGYYIGNLTINTGGVLDNRGSYLFTENTGIDGTGGAIINSGTFGKSGGTGASNLSAAFSNTVTGTLNAGSGTLVLPAFTNTGVIAGSGTINVGGGTIVNQGIIRPGTAGSVGTLSIAGNLDLTGGTLEIDLGGTGAGQSDTLSVTGNVTLGGVLNATLLGVYAPQNGDAISFLTKAGTTLGTTFSSVAQPAGFTTGYNLAAGEAARLIYSLPGTRTFNNSQNNLDWGNALNWSGGMPGSADSALISAGHSVNHAYGTDTVGALTIAGSNSLGVSGGSLTVLGSTVLDGALMVSGSGVTALNGPLNGAATGQLSVTGGVLTLGGTSTLADYTQTGGSLNGAGNLAIGHGFTYSAGTIGLTGRLDINHAGNLTLPGMTSLDSLLARASGNITLTGGIATSGSGNSLVLAAGGDFLNTGGGALSAGGNAGADRWLVYSTAPAGINKGGLTSDFRRYNSTYAAVAPGIVGESGRGFIYAVAPGALTANTTLVSGSASHVYGDASTATFGYTLAGFADAEDNAGNIGLGGSALFAVPDGVTDAGIHAVGYAGGLSSSSGYGIVAGSDYAGYTVTQRALNLTVGGSKIYDKTAVLSAPTFNLGNIANGDALAVSGSVVFTDSVNVGGGKPLSATGIAVTGVKAGNYSYPATQTGSGSITARPITIDGLAIANKVYDGSVAASVTGSATFGNIIGGDAVGVDAALANASFLDANAGTAKPVSVSGLSLTGADAGNYTVAGAVSSATADIGQRPLTIAADAKSMTYGDAVPALSYTLASGNLVGSDSFSGALNSSGSSTADIGNYPITQGNLTAGGNYSIAFNDSTLTIGQRALTLALSGSKVYDKTAVLSAPTFALGNIANGDALAVSGSVVFTDNVNVGSGKPLSASGIAVTGLKAGNYSYPATQTGSGSITARPITIDGLAIANKVYDGTVAASVTGSATFGNIIGGDAVGVDGALANASFLDANAGTAKPVSVSGLSLTGADAGNYTLAGAVSSATADIGQRPLTIVDASGSKVYDGSTSLSAPTISLGNVVVGDNLFAIGNGDFTDNANAGSNKPLSVSGITLSGLHAANYSIPGSAAGLGAITPRPLTISFTAPSKTYDGGTTASIAGYVLNNLVNGDTPGLTGSAAYDDRHVGAAKPVSYSGLALSGGAAGNYSVPALATGTGSITALASVAWTGGASGNWSAATNWAGDALPDGNNVLAVSIPAGISVIFDTATAATQVNSVTVDSGGGFVMAGGSLGIASSLSTPAYTQSGGTLHGTGTLDVSESFSKSGGSLALSGAINIAQATGALTIVNDAPLTLGAVSTVSGNILIDASGGIFTTTSPVTANGGSLAFTAHSPIQVGSGGLAATGDLSLSAPTPSAGSTITLDGPLAAGGAVNVSAHGAIAQNAGIQGQTIALTSSTGNIVVAGGALSSVPAGGSINYSAPAGSITSSPANFAGATPTLVQSSGTTGADTSVTTNDIVNTIKLATEVHSDELDGAPVVPPPPPAETSSGPILLASTGQTTGGDTGTFGGSEPIVGAGDTPGTPAEKPAAESTSARNDESKETGKGKDEQKDEKKEEKAETEEKKDERRAATKKVAQCT
ncbi:MAG: YDG domain-containing protein, partial [Sulfuritalea sp.]|nr:YDG domain-containing protein [Sulfuritalea sp.]